VRVDRVGRGRSRIFAVSVVVVGLGVLVVLGVRGGVAGAAGGVRTGVVLSPQPGQFVPAGPLWVRVRAAVGVGLRVGLNGRGIGGEFSGSRQGVRSLQVSASFGLQFGANVLRVRVGRGRTSVVRFRVGSGRPLAGAGLDREVAVGDGVVLNGRSSRPLPGSNGRELRYSWAVIRTPRSSHVERGRSRSTGIATRRNAPSAFRLVRGASARPLLITDAPGFYTVKLTVTGGGRVGTDFVDVRADPPPVAYLSTSAKVNGGYGVKVDGPGVSGAAFYPGDSTKWLQVVVLNRSDLTEISNTNYDCPQATDAFAFTVPQVCIDRVKAALSALPGCTTANPGACRLVIAVSQPTIHGSGRVQAPVGMFQALGPSLGVRPWSWWVSNESVGRGTFSAIGVPGRPQDVVQRVAADQNVAAPAISGSLVRDNEGNYGLVGTPRTFSTQAPGSDASQNVVEIAGGRFVATAGSRGGFQVVIVDPETLQGKSYWFETGTQAVGPDLLRTLDNMRQVIKRANDDGQAPFSKPPLVIVTSRGVPRIAQIDGLRPTDQTVANLAAEIERAGGTRSAFLSVMDPGVRHTDALASYTLVGRADSPFGSGEESTGAGTTTPPGLNSSPITGTMARSGPYDGLALQTPVLAGAGSGGDGPNGATQLTQLAVAAPSAWPETGKPGPTAAIKWLGQQVLGTNDPRAQYWTLPYSAANWDKISAEIAKQSYTSTPDFTAAELKGAQTELEQEIDWLITTHEYAADLAAPFQQSAFTSWADLQGIAATIAGDVQVSPEQKIAAQSLAVFDFARMALKEVPLVGKVFAFSNEVYDFAAQIAKIQGAPAESKFNTSVADAGKQLAERLTTAQGFITGQLPNSIVSDYARLKTVGTCASVVQADFQKCPTDHAAWQYTQNDQLEAAKTVRAGAATAAYGALLPAKYNLYQLLTHWRTTANTGYGGLEGIVCHAPFKDELPNGQFAKPIFRTTGPNHKLDLYQIYALGYTTGTGVITDPYVMNLPKANVTDGIFGTGAGQLGANPETFFDRFFQPDPGLHYPERDTFTAWSPLCGD
jgi:hypothetical protein